MGKERRVNHSRNIQNIDIGPTAELTLRVSVATQIRVTFPHPKTSEQMLALEHRGTVISSEDTPLVEVMVQPFGGAMRILRFNRLRTLIGRFNFDSERSRDEQDFRIYIRPEHLQKVKTFCIQNFREDSDLDLETDPTRELIEEFEDAMAITLKPQQYDVKTVGTILENEPLPTGNVHATGAPTVRLYRLHEAQIIDPALCQAIVVNSREHSADRIRKLALDDFHRGNKGRSNAIFTVPMGKIREAYLALTPEKRSKPFQFMAASLDRNVPAVLDNVFVPAYQFLGD